RSRVMQEAMHSQAADAGVRSEVPLPSLGDAQSIAVVPLQAEGEVTGVLYLESREAGAFGAHNERLLRVVAAYVASVLRALDPATAPVPIAETAPPERAEASRRSVVLAVTYYQADDSVFVGDEYVVKGVPGRILWKLVREHAQQGRDVFTN